MPGTETMAPALLQDGHFNLREVPQLGEYAGFVFICFDAEGGSLDDYLAGSRDLLELISQQGPQGIEIISGAQQYSIAANWKLLAEWNDISRGVLDPSPSIICEEQMRIFWRRWRDLIARAMRERP